jgi:hypothetical protein
MCVCVCVCVFVCVCVCVYVCVCVCLCAVHKMGVLSVSIISCFSDLLLRYFLDDFVMVPTVLLLLVSCLFCITNIFIIITIISISNAKTQNAVRTEASQYLLLLTSLSYPFFLFVCSCFLFCYSSRTSFVMYA